MRGVPDLYLFPAFGVDPVVRALLALREGQAPARGALYPALLAFSAGKACTPNTVREYALRRLLADSPPHWREAVMVPYLQEDMRVFHDLFFAPDWDALCAENSMLPIPAVGGDGPGEEEYRQTLSAMVCAGSADELVALFTDFLRRYRDENEAMHRAFRWQGELLGVSRPEMVRFDDLHGLEHPKAMLIENTRAFCAGLAANDVLLIGGSGTGKSSCVKAVLHRFAPKGLKMVEVANNALETLPALIEYLAASAQRYIVFIDDLSFEGADRRYLALKVALDGQVASRPDNVLIYATSNRRHLVRETWNDREENEDIHENDTVSEKLSLSERFGIRLYFPSLAQRQYLEIVYALLEKAGACPDEEVKRQAAAWAGAHNGCSGRSARQFVRHYLAATGAPG